MLLNFQFENFHSFKKETNFTMLASQKKAHSDYVMKQSVKNNKTLRTLPAAVIYGANASGKSNIMSAMEIIKDIVKSGTIEPQKIGNKNTYTVTFFIHDEAYYNPMKFEITFCHNRNIYVYGLEISGSDIEHTKVFISKEYLFINDTKAYDRDSKQIFMDIKKLISEGIIEDNSDTYYEKVINSINQKLDKEQLFLAAGFHVMFNNTIYADILEWFDKFNIVMNADKAVMLGGEFEQSDLGLIFENRVIEEIFSHAEFGNQRVKFIKEDDKEAPTIVSHYRFPNNDKHPDVKGFMVNAEVMESKGTLQLLNLVYPFVETLRRGDVIVLDEMDASLHFEVVVSLIRVFNNKELNRHGAQIIFNTHNPIYLDGELLRHDQIVLVKKSKDDLSSELYSLADYDLRPEEKLLKNYLEGKYGALPHMDLEHAFKNILSDKDKEQ